MRSQSCTAPTTSTSIACSRCPLDQPVRDDLPPRADRSRRRLPRPDLHPGGELPFAGHPTLGSCHAWLERGGTAAPGEVVQQCGVGLVAFAATRGAGLRGAAVALAPVETRPCSTASPARSACRDDDPRPGARQRPGWVACCSTAPKPCWPEPDRSAATLASRRDRAATPGAAGFRSPCLCPARGLRRRPGHRQPQRLPGAVADGRRPRPARYTPARARDGRRGRVRIARDGGTVWVGGSTVTCVNGTATL